MRLTGFEPAAFGSGDRRPITLFILFFIPIQPCRYHISSHLTNQTLIAPPAARPSTVRSVRRRAEELYLAQIGMKKRCSCFAVLL